MMTIDMKTQKLINALTDCAKVMDRDLNGLALIQPELAQAKQALEDFYLVDSELELWNGEGLPPVGIKVEFLGSHGGVEQWKEARVVAHDKGFAVLGYLTANYFAIDPDKVRPIRKPEQIAAEEREQCLSQIEDVISPLVNKDFRRLAAETIFDAGYRKQVKP